MLTTFCRLRRLCVGLGAAMLLATAFGQANQRPLTSVSGPRFEIAFSKEAHAEPITGRVYVAISRTSDARRTPIQQTDVTGVPLFSAAIDTLAAGQTASIDGGTLGHPIPSLRDIPAGEYFVQPFVNVYTKFPRADGHTLWLHMDQWEGQNWKRSPGNIYGDPVKITFDPASSTPIRLTADKVIPPIQVPADTDDVKRIRIQSTILSRWWGHPIYLGATILLPKDYEKHPTVKYPIVYEQGHFSLGAPGGFVTPAATPGAAPAGAGAGPVSGAGAGAGRGGRGGAFADYWLAESTPRLIYATLQHPSPYYDDSYGVNSANNGPYGDAIMRELLPAIETTFRVERQPWARLLTGGSTGGWIALAHQVFYPDFYGGAFGSCPDSVDFRYHQIVNIYQDANAYWTDMGWMKLDRPDTRRPDGNVTSMMKDENWYELVQGDHSRSGGQWDIWEATYSPVGPEGYPMPIWDKKTGVIDKKVADYWKQHFDLRNILETDWATLGPKVANKINVYVGDADTYYLNMGVHMLENFLKTTANPKWTGELVFQPMAPHCWGPSRQELMQKVVAQIEKVAPAGADLKSWRY
jgi:Putative esterase